MVEANWSHQPPRAQHHHLKRTAHLRNHPRIVGVVHAASRFSFSLCLPCQIAFLACPKITFIGISNEARYQFNRCPSADNIDTTSARVSEFYVMIENEETAQANFSSHEGKTGHSSYFPDDVLTEVGKHLVILVIPARLHGVSDLTFARKS